MRVGKLSEFRWEIAFRRRFFATISIAAVLSAGAGRAQKP